MMKNITRRHKGDACFLLEKKGDIFHFTKNIKVYSKKQTKGESKTTRVIVSDFYFNQCDFEKIDFTLNGLREGDKTYMLNMLEELNG